MAEEVDQSQLAPRERTILLPSGVPELTLGWGALAWITDNLRQPDGPHAGEPFRCTEGQVRFLLHFYALDEAGRWLYRRGVRRLAKGSGKSPFAAVLALFELLGPARFAEFDPDVPGGVIGKPVAMPLVQIAATSERQCANTMRMVRAMSNKNTALARKFDIQPGKTFIETPNGGRLEQITSSASTAEGAISTFTVCDETEHWTPGVGGPALMGTLLQNAVKSSSRVVETCNAWVPGVEAVAESTFDAWCAEEEGQTRGEQRILYDARVAPANTALHDEPEPGQISLTEGLEFVYADCPWVNVDSIKEQVWDVSYPESRSRRFFLNQPNAAENAWVSLQEWSVLADTSRELVDGEDVVLFFDGSKSNDHTALVGCCMSDGHVFTVGVWKPEESTGVINAARVDAVVERTFERFNVVAFWADVREWEQQTKTTWPERYKEQLLVWASPHGREAAPIAWDMRSHSYQFAENAEMCLAEIQDGVFTHDGNWDTSRHIGNCRVTEFRGRFTVKKESPKSPNKIDAAVCVIGARMVYRAVKGSSEWERRNRTSSWSVVL